MSIHLINDNKNTLQNYRLKDKDLKLFQKQRRQGVGESLLLGLNKKQIIEKLIS